MEEIGTSSSTGWDDVVVGYNEVDCNFGGGGDGNEGDGGSDGSLPGDGATSGDGNGSGEGGGGGTGSNDQTNDSNDPTEPGSNCRGCSDIATSPIEDIEEKETPCDELNKLTQNPNYPTHPYMDSQDKRIRTAITNMSDEISPSSEAGYGFYNQGNYPEYGPYANYTPPSGDNHVHFPKKSYQFGTIHTHPSTGHMQMFSHDDIYSLLTIAESYNSGPLGNLNTSGNDLFVCVLVVQIGTTTYTYAIKIEDFSKLQALHAIHPPVNGNGTDTTWDDFGESLNEYYVNNANGADGTKSQYEETFLKFLKEHDLGVALYEMEQTGFGTPQVNENWEKLELDSNNQPKRIPCN